MNRTKFLLATALVAPIAFSATAQAADLPAQVFEPVAPIVAPVVTPFTFGGFYVGVTGGYAFGDYGDDDDDEFFSDDNGDDFGFGDDDDASDSLYGGVLAGFNAQFGRFVVGYETDFAGVDIDRETRRTRSMTMRTRTASSMRISTGARAGTGRPSSTPTSSARP
jgi:hypothetical protein